MRDSIFKNVLVNLRAAFTTNIRKRLNDNTHRIAIVENAIAKMDFQITEKFHYLNVLDYYSSHKKEAEAYLKELEFLYRYGNYCNFPYASDDEQIKVVSGFDSETSLPYVVHNGKKLFFPSGCSAEWSYLNLVQKEKLLGVDDLGGTPHQYQSPKVHVEEGDVVIDIGAAEGLFALDQIEKASQVIIVENDSRWLEPLRYTFAPFVDKTTIINKSVSAFDTENTVSLAKLLSNTDHRSIFVKMDIEGYELPSIMAATDFLKARSGIKMAVASYHKQHDYEELKRIFEQVGYWTESSNGYMLFHSYDMPMPPYFRHGIIRAFH